MMGVLSFWQLGLIGIAGAAGALLRYLFGWGIARQVNTALPVATWLINLSGAFAIGLVTGLAGRHLLTTEAQLVLASGFLGGYTTFGTMHWEATQLAHERRAVLSFLYLASTLALGVTLAASGLLLGGWR